MHLLAPTLALLLAVPALAIGQQPAPNPIKKIAPLLEPQTILVAHIPLDKLDPAQLVKTISDIGQLKPDESGLLEDALKKTLTTLKNAGAKEIFAVVSLEGIGFEPVYFAIPVEEGQDSKKMAEALKPFGGPLNVHPLKGFVIKGFHKVAERLEKLLDEGGAPPAHAAQFEKAFAAFDKADARLAVALPDTLRKAIGELMPELPKEFGRGKTAPLLDGFQYLAVGATFAPKLSLEGILQASDAQAAKAGHNLFMGIINQLKKEVPDPKLGPQVEKAIKVLTPKQDKNRLTLTLTETEFTDLAKPIVAEMRRAAELASAVNHLKQIAIAMHSYHDGNKHLPTNIYDKDGKPLLSWRVQILPYVEQGQLYNQFKLDEPWDSPHNKKLIDKMPPVFRSPFSKAKPGHATYLAPFGEGLFMHGPTPRKLQEIKDGTSNTIMTLEVDDDAAVIWTKPEDLVIDPKQPLKHLGGDPTGRFTAGFMDGSVRILQKQKIDPDIFYKLLTVAGGEAVSLP